MVNIQFGLFWAIHSAYEVLLTIDTDFVEPLLGAKQCGQLLGACIPERHYNVVKRYRRAGISVRELPQGGSGSKVS